MLSLRADTLTAWTLAIGLLIGFCSFNSATAAVVSSSDFEVIETAGPGNTGYYTVINNSASEYIYGFSVTNPLASSVDNWTTEPDWLAGKTPLQFYPKTGFGYLTAPGYWTFSRGRPVFHVSFLTIGPNESSSNFFFGTAELASVVTLLLVDAKGNFSSMSFDATQATPAVPEASTWAMMILGFASIGVLAYRRRRSGCATA
nr:PEP-CTERM sorting domain-containing protein [Bradyrhizobium lablabi]